MLIQYRKAMKLARTGVWEWDVKTNETKWGDEKFVLFGYEPNEFELNFENAFKTVHPDDKEHIFKVLEEKLPKENFFDYEYRGIKKDGSIMNIWVRVNVERDEEGAPAKVYGVSQDITERKQLENKIRQLNESLEAKVEERTFQLQKKNEENILLVKEMHHRVKNNLQVISSILNMQQIHIQDNTVNETLSECVNRIKSMAIIHDSLYTTDNLSEIELSDYIDKLVKMNVKDENITCNLLVPNMHLSINKMVPIGLIVNELISNSMKHAFNGLVSKPEIGLEISNNSSFRLKYYDNGRGFEVIAKREKPSFGMELIETLCEDTEVEYNFISSVGNGMKFMMSTQFEN